MDPLHQKLQEDEDLKSAGKISKKGTRRRKQQIKKATKLPSKSIDRKLFPDAMSIPVVKRDHGYSSALMDSALRNVKILSEPEKTYYLVDVQSLLELFLMFENSIKALHRQGGWKHQGYYAGVFFRCLAARLQRVAHFTDTAAFNQRETIRSPGEIPIIVAHCINQFGVKHDVHNNVLIAPYVTFELIAAILRLSRDLIHGPVGAAAADHAAIVDANNWCSWIEICYGVVPNYNVICGCAFRSIGLPYTPGSTVPECSMYAAIANDMYNQQNAIPRCTGAQFIAVSANPTPLLANAVVAAGGGVLGPIAGVDATVSGAFDAQTDAFSSAADPFNGTPLPVGSVAAFRTAPSPMVLEVELMELRARYTVSQVSLSPEGSFAPIVVGADLDGNCTASCVVKGVTEIEYMFGILLDNTVVLTGPDLKPFNFAAASRHSMRYKMSALPYTRVTLLAKAMRECITRRKG